MPLAQHTGQMVIPLLTLLGVLFVFRGHGNTLGHNSPELFPSILGLANCLGAYRLGTKGSMYP